MIIARRSCPDCRYRDHVDEIERGDRRLTDIGVEMAGQRAEPRLDGVQSLGHAGEVTTLNDFFRRL